MKIDLKKLSEAGEKFRLAPREKECAALLAQGKSRKIVAQELGIAHKTVCTHTERLFLKVSAHSVTEMVFKIFLRS